ncbi:MAG: hypothetical protein BWY31_04145 [Lentisphaerae bacterium ADurb.Bin242]|nr:MAG: hypothetical protein BWY31_04145 [Lentisphaerae bacterium ADurb.Bin242]
MQNTTFYVAANETLGVVKDYANAKTVTPPTLVRGVAACLKMRLFAKNDGTEACPLSAFANIVSWQWAMDNDFNEATTYKLVGDNGGITVSAVTETADGEETTYTEISIPMSGMNTEELAAWLGTEKSKSGLAGELVGFDANGSQIFILQVENFTVRNRITSIGNPTPIDPDYLTATQVRALLAAGMECEFSLDGTAWHVPQTDLDRFIHFRLRGDVNGIWSDAIGLVVGPKGDPGADSFCHVAYASDSTGANFSLTPANGLKFRAEIHTAVEIPSPSATDFAEAVWVKYIGDDGAGVGDMVKSVYDTNDDGKVDSAEEADHATNADAVPWTGVTGKPSTYAPTAHSHVMADISNPVNQKVYSASNPKTLYLDSPIVRNTASNSSGTIELEFTAIMDKAGGSAYSAADGVMLTWEYHVLCSAAVTGVSVGSVRPATSSTFWTRRTGPGTWPMVPSTSGWPAWPISTTPMPCLA